MASESSPLPNPPKKEYRELTVAAVVLGVIQGIILNVAFVYAALQLGFSIGGSTVAAIMGFAILRGLMATGTMVENNINQTIASGINTAGTGIVFTVPALFILSSQDPDFKFEWLPLAIAGVAGAILGVVVIIPLRKQMIELDNLRFPSGVATATIIRAGSSGIEKAKLLACGVAISACWKLLMATGVLDASAKTIEATGFGISHEELHFSFNVIPDYLSPVLYLSLMNIAAGLLAGRGGLPFFAGGVISWWLISPSAVQMGWVPENGGVGFIYGMMLRPLGIGVLIGGALMGVVMAFPAIRSALQSLASAAKSAGSGVAVGGDELKLRSLILGAIASVILFFVASIQVEGVSTTQAAVSAVVGTFWLALAALIVAQATGMTDISPMSGMSLISVTLMMFLLNGNIAGAMVVGVAVCVAIGQGADMMQDLKTGHMIGARPVKQQTVQFCVTWIGALVALGVIYILWMAGPDGKNGFGPDSQKLTAPQGGALAGVIQGIKDGNVPADKYAMGAAVGGILGAAPQAGLGVLIGLAMYLPFSITFGYGIGCLVQMAITRLRGVDFTENKLVPFAAGLIVGEALTGIIHTGYTILSGAKTGEATGTGVAGASLSLAVVVLTFVLLGGVAIWHFTQVKPARLLTTISSNPLKFVAYALFGVGTAVAVVGGAQYPDVDQWVKDNPPKAAAEPEPKADDSDDAKKDDAKKDDAKKDDAKKDDAKKDDAKKDDAKKDDAKKDDAKKDDAKKVDAKKVAAKKVDAEKGEAKRWPDSTPLFLFGFSIGIVGLITWYGSLRRKADSEAVSEDGKPILGPVELLSGLAISVTDFDKTVASHDASELSVRIQAILEEFVFPFQQQRRGITDRFGMRDGAEVLVTFAFGERMLNRALSAALDDNKEEAVESFHQATAGLEEMEKQLKALLPA